MTRPEHQVDVSVTDERGVARVAEQLLQLEMRHQAERTLGESADRWRELIVELLAAVCPEEDQRRNLRLPARAVATLELGDRQFACTVLDVSRLGLAVAGDLPGLDIGAELVLGLSLRAGDPSVALPCVVAWQETTPGDSWSRRTGLQLSALDPGIRRSYFDAAYYPLYLSYLRRLATVSDASI